MNTIVVIQKRSEVVFFVFTRENYAKVKCCKYKALCACDLGRQGDYAQCNCVQLMFTNQEVYLGSFQRVILELLRVAMVNIPNTKGFIVDGFPREIEQGKEFENEVSMATFLLLCIVWLKTELHSISLNRSRRVSLCYTLSVPLTR